MKLRKVFGVTAALAIALPLAGCVVDTAEPGDAPADSDAGITIACGNIEDLCESVLAKFTESTGIDANYVRMSGGEVIARLEASKGSPSAEFDLWWGGPIESFVAAAERDLLASYKSPVRDNLQEKMKDDDGLWTGYMINPNGICYNKSVLESLGVDEPDSWADLLDPKLKGNITTSHPGTSGTGFGFVSTIIALEDDNEDAAFDWLEQMHPNVLQYTKSGSAPVQMIVRSEVAMVPALASVCELERVKNGNDNVAFAYPKEGVGYELGGMGIVEGATNMDGAQKFIDWALGKEAFGAVVDLGYHVFPPYVGEGTDNGLGQTVDDIPWLENFDPTDPTIDRGGIVERFDTEIAPQPVE